MINYICLVMGIIIFALCLGLGIAFRSNSKKCTSTLFVGVLFATFFLVLPVTETSFQSDAFTMAVQKLLSALIYSLDALSGGQDISIITPETFSGVLGYIYLYVCYIMFFTAPIISSSLIISFLGDTGDKIRYALRFSKKCYVFSDLNKDALSIATGIRKTDKKAVIVFCNTKSKDGILTEKSRRLGGINFYKSCTAFHTGKFRSVYEFFLVSENEDESVKYASEIIEKNKNTEKGKVIINAFAQSGVSIDIIESIPQNNINIRFIDKVALLCSQILYLHPLYNLPDGSRNISVAIIGAGRTGIQMLKTAVWCGQIDGHSLKIRVYDTEAEKSEKSFFGQAPELALDEYDIKFISANACYDDFEEKIVQNSKDATYVFIATGDDELNLQAAVRLRRIFRKITGRYDINPPILTRVRDDFKTKNIKNNKFLAERNIIPFGNASDLFEEAPPFESKFEKLALGVHLAYCGILSDALNKYDYEDAKEVFCSHEYDRRSSMATALHIGAKLYSAGLSESDENLGARLDEHIDRLAKNEHNRWNAFFRSEGYQGAGLEEVKKYADKEKSHKDIQSKTHPCITEWDNLISFEKEYNDYANTNKRFLEYDREIVRAIPDILRFANQE